MVKNTNNNLGLISHNMKLTKQKIGFRILLLFLALAGMTSCVSKKKYLAMESSRNRASDRVKVLTQEVAELKSEFNGFKNDFHLNNSEKDIYIDSLNREIVGLNADLMSKEENIEGQLFSFQVEKRRLNALLMDKDREIRELEHQINYLEVEANKLKDDALNSSLEVQNAKGEVRTLERQIRLKESTINRLNSELDRSKSEATRYERQIEEKDEEIRRLNNQVKLLKSQLAQ